MKREEMNLLRRSHCSSLRFDCLKVMESGMAKQTDMHKLASFCKKLR